MICGTYNRISNFSKAPLIPSFLIIKVEYREISNYRNRDITIYKGYYSSDDVVHTIESVIFQRAPPYIIISDNKSRDIGKYPIIEIGILL